MCVPKLLQKNILTQKQQSNVVVFGSEQWATDNYL